MFRTHTKKQWYSKSLSIASVRFAIVITQFRVTTATNFRALTYYMNVSYAIDHV
jgi:hypothetical protein